MTRFITKGLLFKYAPYNQYLFNLLINGEFWMSPPDKLNDPFEGDFKIKDISLYQNERFIKKLLTFKRKNFIDDFLFDEQFDKSIDDEYYFSNILYEYINELIRNKYGISCFSRNPKNLKMWSHYADSHRGICLIFDEEKLGNSVLSKNTGVTLKEIVYSKSLTFIDIVNHDCDENGDDFIGIEERNTSFLFNKLASWKEENEVRLLLNKEFNTFPDRRLKFDRTSLKGIIFGARIQTEDILTIVNLINRSDQKSKIKFYIAQKDFEKPRIKLKQLKI